MEKLEQPIMSQASNEEGATTIPQGSTLKRAEAPSPTNVGDDIVCSAWEHAGGNINREGYFISDTHRECTKCGAIFEITSKMTLCKKCNSERVKSQTPEWKMHQRAKQRCKRNGLEFAISVDDIVIPDKCPILGIELNMNSGKSGAYKNSPSLDRIDNNKGYTPDNIQVISQLANAMKGAASDEELVAFAHWVINSRLGSSEPK